MKKSTKKTIMALAIILTFGLSSIAFVATGLVGSSQQSQFEPLESPVVEGELNPVYESTYVQNGFTWIKYYYAQDSMILSLIESLPQTFTAPSGQAQIIVQKIKGIYINETNYMIISSLEGQESFSNPDDAKIFTALCGLLTFPPIECGFENATNAP